MRILFIGDIVGQSGRLAIAQILPKLKEELSPVFIIANGENAAGGLGITKDIALDLIHYGVDVITLGNHAWAKKESYTYIDTESRILRPANYPDGAPGRGSAIYPTATGESIGVISLCGRIFMDPLDNPFKTADKITESMKPDTNVILIDFHGEATSEKCAFGLYIDGRVSAVVGTHTHIQTADEKVLPQGTAYITDVGMTGPINSVIGVKTDIIISKFLSQMPAKHEIAEGDSLFCAVVIDVDSSTGKAVGIRRLQIKNIVGKNSTR
ncbi:MAG: TIGR00282 family metallophosphoesterase [Armatimonadota bacterium]